LMASSTTALISGMVSVVFISIFSLSGRSR
jgi:hypothetical protein